MKILVQAGIGANFFIKRTMARAYSYCGYETVFWQPEGKSSHDLFSEFPPNIFIGHTWGLDRALVKNLIKAKDLKVMLSCNHWGSSDGDIDREKFPIEFASDKEKDFVEELVKNNVDLHLMCQYSNNRVGNTHNLWDQLGVHCNGILLSADITSYFPPDKKPEKFTNDLILCSGYWPYKAKNLDKYIRKLLYPNTAWRIKIFGAGWASVNCVGRADEKTLREYYANSIISPNIFEAHSTEFGLDVNQRTFEVPQSWGFTISQRVKSIEEDIFTNNEIVFVDSPEEFFEKCVYFLNFPLETIPYRDKSFKEIIKNHTSLHRILEINKILNEDISFIQPKISELYEKYSN